MATAAEIQAQIAQLDLDIAAAQQSQSYSIGGRSLTRGNLESMYRRRDALEARLSRVLGGGIRGRLGTPV